MADHKHLDLSQRIHIQDGLKQRKSFKAIANELGKDNTTISKEVRNHRIFKQIGSHCTSFNDCANRKGCSVTGLCQNCTNQKKSRCAACIFCRKLCHRYQKEICKNRNKPPYVCNGCLKRNSCSLEKVFYEAASAQKEYEALLSERRSGRNITEEELARINSIVSPLVRNGQSIHHIMISHANEVMCCEKTLYSYVNDGLLDARNIDMPRKVRFRPRKGKKPVFKVDKACRTGRSIQDFHAFMTEHPDLPVTELDSVEGIKGGKVLLTVHFVRTKLQLAFEREANDSKSVTDYFNDLYLKLGHEAYCKLFPVLLADNGSEFSDPSALEFSLNGIPRSRVFYCDPASPGQKGACENNHTMIRRVIPKGTDIGKYSQSQIDTMMNNINSYCRSDLGDKSPYAVFSFLYGEDLLAKLGCTKIPKDKIVLKPSLLDTKISPM